MRKRSSPLEVPQPLPCPCCGEARAWPVVEEGDETDRGIRVGIISSMKSGVECRSCGLSLCLGWPDDYPKGVSDPEGMYAYTAMRAVEAWNRRITDA